MPRGEYVDEIGERLGVEGAWAEPAGRGVRARIGILSGLAAGPEAMRFLEPITARLAELGFVEGAAVEVLHEGLLGRDPIAVRVDGVTIALRRREAMAVIVTPAAESE